MQSITILIVDDDLDFCNVLKFHLETIGYKNIVIAHNIKDGQSAAQREKPDLAILDNKKKKNESGIDLGKFLRINFPSIPIIFITNNYKEDVYEEAMPISPKAFLNKELSTLKVRQAVQSAINTISINQTENSPVETPISEVFIKVGTHYKKINLAEVEYFFYEDRHANLISDGVTYPLNTTMKNLAQFLPKEFFIQVHQSFIVNIKKITKISLSNGEIELSEKTIPIGKKKKKSVQERLPILF
ncbi:MAG: LytR/AlgR family response regulator transcription factor [Saprospiraceae bacterium]